MDESNTPSGPPEPAGQSPAAPGANPLQAALDSFYAAFVIAQFPGAFDRSARAAGALEDEILLHIDRDYERLGLDEKTGAAVLDLIAAAVDFGAARLLAHMAREIGEKAALLSPPPYQAREWKH